MNLRWSRISVGLPQEEQRLEDLFVLQTTYASTTLKGSTLEIGECRHREVRGPVPSHQGGGTRLR
jgi:hypothetical protein